MSPSMATPEGRLQRAKIAGSVAVKVGAGELAHRIKRPFLSTATIQADKLSLDEKNAKLVFKAISQLRGTALKIAQMLSMEVDLVPEAYRNELAKSYHQVPPLNRVLVRKAIMAELEASPEILFKDFDYNAFAAASFGQVHSATLQNNREVAVKLQYPGIHVALESDMDIIRKVARRLPNSKLILGTLEEILSRLREEVNYKIEAENTRWFKENLCVVNIQCAEVISDISTERVLVTERLYGEHLEEWLQTSPSQHQRNQVAQAIYDAFVYSTLSLKCLHADPNPGNYLFLADGTVGLIDFGCIKVLDDIFVEDLPKLLKAYAELDQDAIIEIYRKFGCDLDDADVSVFNEVLKPFGLWLTEPLENAVYDFAKNSDYTSRGRELIQQIGELPGLENLIPDFIFFDRTIYGLVKIFERLEASVEMRHHWLES